MYNSASLNRYYTEGILHITCKGEILKTTPQARSLLTLFDSKNANLFNDYSFLDKKNYNPISLDKIVKKNVSYINKINSKNKSMYIFAAFAQSDNKEKFIVCILDNTDLIEKFLDFQ